MMQHDEIEGQSVTKIYLVLPSPPSFLSMTNTSLFVQWNQYEVFLDNYNFTLIAFLGSEEEHLFHTFLRKYFQNAQIFYVKIQQVKCLTSDRLPALLSAQIKKVKNSEMTLMIMTGQR